MKFDNSDAFWLRGYCHILSASLEFVLAYDWRSTFDRTAGLFYPRVAPPPFGANPRFASSREGSFVDYGHFADVIVLIHEIRWPLLEPSRLRAAHGHLKQVVAMSRASWKSILAETTEDREWIPGPQQRNGVVTSMPVTQAQVDGWLHALDDFDAVLGGTRLIPYWRFSEGFNFKRVFFWPRDFWCYGPLVIAPYRTSKTGRRCPSATGTSGTARSTVIFSAMLSGSTDNSTSRGG